MNNYFNCIGIIGYPRSTTGLKIHKTIYKWLCNKGYKVIIERSIAKKLKLTTVITGTLPEIGQKADLAIVVGGDGNMLNAARTLAFYDIKVIGINLGNLGFLTDLNPENAKQQLSKVLKGDFHIENRFLLEVRIFRKGYQKRIGTAVNEVVLHPEKSANMIEFDVYIDETFAFSQRSDGLIISTPTGSTAYSLSAGGPILTPVLDAIALIPMFPHTLSSRPLVIGSKSIIRLHFLNYKNSIEISCDSQIVVPVKKGENVLIQRCNHNLDLIHPNDCNYFSVLNTKLGWSKKNFD